MKKGLSSGEEHVWFQRKAFLTRGSGPSPTCFVAPACREAAQAGPRHTGPRARGTADAPRPAQWRPPSQDTRPSLHLATTLATRPGRLQDVSRCERRADMTMIVGEGEDARRVGRAHPRLDEEPLEYPG